MNEEKINIYSLKNILKAELSIINEKKKVRDNAKYQLGVFEEIVSLINVKDINILLSNIFSLAILLPLIYSEEEAKTIENTLYSLIFQLNNLSKYPELKNEYEKEAFKLQIFLDKIIRDYEILKNKLITYESEYSYVKNNASLCRSILYRLKEAEHINGYQINFIKELLAKKGFSKEQIIIIIEFINHHNQKINYKKPMISFTTIKMMESNFTLYDIDELIDKDTKDKLDDIVNSIFETIYTDKDGKMIIETIEGMTSWMDDTMLSYTLKMLLNKFLTCLQDCKNAMLEEDNYENIESRKCIIDEYNHYLHNYLKTKSYYEAKLDEVESLYEEPVLEPEEPIEVVKMFFAMSGDKAYVEKDILDVPEEYYLRVKKLLEGFKTGTLPKHNIENFSSNSNLKGYQKLKEDQIRIVFRVLNNNNYLILGIMVKKDNKGTREYLKIIKRDYPYDISSEELYIQKELESSQIYANLIAHIDTYSRVGNR